MNGGVKLADYIIEVNNAVKKFKETTALKQVSVNFEEKKIHGIIGRNGSGKTVLFKAICGFMKLDSGQIKVNNKPIKPAVAQNIGIIIEEPGFIGSLSGFKNLKLLASIHKKISDEEIRKTLEEVGLDSAKKKNVRKYS